MTVRELLPRGAYLAPTTQIDNERAATLLLPRREAPEHLQPRDVLDVFVYLDSEDRPIATTLVPRLELGQVAYLTVTDIAPFGVFVDWNLPKELLVPFAEQTCEMRIGERYPTGLFLDDTGRLAGTMRVSEMLREKPRFAPDEWVQGEAWRNEPGLGVFIIVEKAYVGLLPASEPHRLSRGQAARFRVSNILADGKIELSLRRRAFEELDDDVAKVLGILQQPNCLKLGDHSSPEQIRARFGLSKKAFKRAVGRLMKQGVVSIDDSGCVFVKHTRSKSVT